MGIGRKVGGKIALKVSSIERLRPQPLLAEIRARTGSAFEQVVHPHPGKTSKGHLQAARPVDPQRVRVCRVPVLPLRMELLCVALVSGQPVRFGQYDQMLVPVQFPGHLAVAHFLKVKVSDAVKWLLRRGLPVDEVEVPIDRRAVVQVFISQ